MGALTYITLNNGQLKPFIEIYCNGRYILTVNVLRRKVSISHVVIF